VEKNKILMLGQFPPLVTGEGNANAAVRSILESNGCSVDVVDSCIIENVGGVGEFSLNKVGSAMLIIFKAIFSLKGVDLFYATPGQTLFGIFRFLPILFAARLLRKRVYLHWHGYGILSLVNKYSVLKIILFNKSTAHFLLTEDLKNKLLLSNCLVDNCTVVRNFHNDLGDSFVKGVSPGKLNVLFLSGLMLEKGIFDFIEAAGISKQFNFIVCGKGAPEVEREIKCSQVKGNISFLGMVKGAEKEAVFSSADVFVLQTYHPTEGVPLTIIEAMASGCAVVTTKHNGIPETVGQAALFVEPKSAGALLSALSDLNEDRERLQILQKKSYEQSLLFTYEQFEQNLLVALDLRVAS
jgi:glycosyltransferase involved in cell wall biosynthesis